MVQRNRAGSAAISTKAISSKALSPLQVSWELGQAPQSLTISCQQCLEFNWAAGSFHGIYADTWAGGHQSPHTAAASLPGHRCVCCCCLPLLLQLRSAALMTVQLAPAHSGCKSRHDARDMPCCAPQATATWFRSMARS